MHFCIPVSMLIQTLQRSLFKRECALADNYTAGVCTYSTSSNAVSVRRTLQASPHRGSPTGVIDALMRIDHIDGDNRRMQLRRGHLLIKSQVVSQQTNVLCLQAQKPGQT